MTRPTDVELAQTQRDLLDDMDQRADQRAAEEKPD